MREREDEQREEGEGEEVRCEVVLTCGVMRRVNGSGVEEILGGGRRATCPASLSLSVRTTRKEEEEFRFLPTNVHHINLLELHFSSSKQQKLLVEQVQWWAYSLLT